MKAVAQFPRCRLGAAAGLAAALLGLAGMATPAQARVWVGFGFGFPGFGFPLVVGPPLYYAPPAYYYPPPVYVPPPGYYPPPSASYTPQPPSAGAGQSCYAGAYVCPMDNPVASGAACYCLGNQGVHVWGHAN